MDLTPYKENPSAPRNQRAEGFRPQYRPRAEDTTPDARFRRSYSPAPPNYRRHRRGRRYPSKAFLGREKEGQEKEDYIKRIMQRAKVAAATPASSREASSSSVTESAPNLEPIQRRDSPVSDSPESPPSQERGPQGYAQTLEESRKVNEWLDRAHKKMQREVAENKSRGPIPSTSNQEKEPEVQQDEEETSDNANKGNGDQGPLEQVERPPVPLEPAVVVVNNKKPRSDTPEPSPTEGDSVCEITMETPAKEPKALQHPQGMWRVKNSPVMG